MNINVNVHLIERATDIRYLLFMNTLEQYYKLTGENILFWKLNIL